MENNKQFFSVSIYQFFSLTFKTGFERVESLSGFSRNKSRQGYALGRLLILFTSVFLSCSLSSITLAAPPDELSGELDVIHKDDFKNQTHFENDYFLRGDNGVDWYQLQFSSPPPAHLRSGQRIRVKGRRNEHKFHVESLEKQSSVNDQKNDTGNLTTTDSSTPASVQIVDARSTVVLLVDLTNAKTGSYTTPAQVAGKMFTDVRSVDGLYREASQQQLSFPADTDGDGKPDVFGPFAINYDNSTCDYYSWASAAEQAAQLAGINLSLYRHRVFVLPTSLPACTWNGIANVGCGTFCRAWIAGSSGTIFAHELGHNLNMAHAGTDPENDSTINNVYGDVSDPMGSAGSSWRMFNAAHMDQMGWYANIPGAVSTVTSNGIFYLAAIGLDPTSASGAPFMLKIAKPNTGDLYYLSYRQPIGNYNQLSTTYTKGINIHRYKGSGYGYTTHIKTLIDGETYTDSVNGISFSQISQSNGFATVQVSYGCAAIVPTASLSPAKIVMPSGNNANFSINVTNMDNSSCGNTTFSLSYAGGAVSGSLSASQLTLAPAQTGSSALSINTQLADGNYPLTLSITDNDGKEPNHSTNTQANATLVIDNTPPSTPASTSGTINKQGAIVLSWQASTDTLSGVADYPVYRNNGLIGYATSNSYTDSTAVSGVSYEYAIGARDNAGNRSLTSYPLMLSIGSTGGTKKSGGRK